MSWSTPKDSLFESTHHNEPTKYSQNWTERHNSCFGISEQYYWSFYEYFSSLFRNSETGVMPFCSVLWIFGWFVVMSRLKQWIFWCRSWHLSSLPFKLSYWCNINNYSFFSSIKKQKIRETLIEIKIKIIFNSKDRPKVLSLIKTIQTKLFNPMTSITIVISFQMSDSK